jgi:hypothetical protein
MPAARATYGRSPPAETSAAPSSTAAAAAKGSATAKKRLDRRGTALTIERERCEIVRAVRPRLAILLASVAILVVGARACLGPEERIAFLLYDDAYYYAGVARHLAGGEGSTFDGIHGTNGYHPLWCWILVPLTRVVRDPGLAARAVGVLWFGLAALVPWAAWTAFRRRLGDGAAAVAAALFGLEPWIALSLARANGLETPLYALVLLASIAAFDRWIGDDTPPSLVVVSALGALAGCAALARLDGGFLPVALAAIVLVAGGRQWGPGPALARAVALGAAASAIVAPSLVWNDARFDSPMPVSGRTVALQAAAERAASGGTLSPANLAHRVALGTAGIPALVARRALEGLPGVRLLRHAGPAGGLVAVLALAAAGVLAWRSRPNPTRLGDPVRLLTVFVAMHYVVYAAWLWTEGEETYRVYYFMPEVLLVAVVAGIAVSSLLEASPRLARIAAWSGGALLVLHLLQQSESYLGWQDARPGRVAERFVYGWIRRTLPPDAVLGARDAGKLGWFSGHPVVGLDGLIGDQRMIEALRDGTEARFICDSTIRYLLFDRPWVGGFDPGNPTKPPEDGRGLPGVLHRLATSGTCALRDAGPATEDWVVLEIVRPPL